MNVIRKVEKSMGIPMLKKKKKKGEKIVNHIFCILLGPKNRKNMVYKNLYEIFQ